MGASSYCVVWSRSAREMPIRGAFVQGRASPHGYIFCIYTHYTLLWKWNSIIVYIGSVPPHRVKKRLPFYCTINPAVMAGTVKGSWPLGAFGAASFSNPHTPNFYFDLPSSDECGYSSYFFFRCLNGNIYARSDHASLIDRRLALVIRFLYFFVNTQNSLASSLTRE